uniref:Uncharacterized protein n=1 Tax=Triticum urartu TaxID=4572 RepID=A0A8R7QP79_TRIUA
MCTSTIRCENSGWSAERSWTYIMIISLLKICYLVDRTDQVSMEVVISLPAGSLIARKH